MNCRNRWIVCPADSLHPATDALTFAVGQKNAVHGKNRCRQNARAQRPAQQGMTGQNSKSGDRTEKLTTFGAGSTDISQSRAINPSATTTYASASVQSVFAHPVVRTHKVSCQPGGVMGYWAVTAASRNGEVAAVAPFRYVSLVFAICIGMSVFQEFPDRITLLGAAIIILSGLYSIGREHLRKRALSMAASPR